MLADGWTSCPRPGVLLPPDSTDPPCGVFGKGWLRRMIGGSPNLARTSAHRSALIRLTGARRRRWMTDERHLESAVRLSGHRMRAGSRPSCSGPGLRRDSPMAHGRPAIAQLREGLSIMLHSSASINISSRAALHVGGLATPAASASPPGPRSLAASAQAIPHYAIVSTVSNEQHAHCPLPPPCLPRATVQPGQVHIFWTRPDKVMMGRWGARARVLGAWH